MIINIKYFGLLADIAKKREEQIVLEDSVVSVALLKSKMESAYQGLQNATYTIAVNQAMVGLEGNIQDQDVIAFLPPFAGG